MNTRNVPLNKREHEIMFGTPRSAWIDPMQERFNVTAASDAALHRLMRDYPRTTQVERADHLPLFAAMLAGGVALAVMAIRRILGRLLP